MTGIQQRHGNRCTGKGRCDCPWQASIYSKRDGRKIRKAFPSKAAAVAWRDDSRSAVRKQTMRAPTSETLRDAAQAWLDGARAGLIRPRSGDPYKPSAIRNYERGLRLRILPELGSRKLSDITRTDLQDFVDGLVARGECGATIEATVIPLRAIYRRAVSRPESGIAVNPTTGLELPSARGKRDRIAPPAECAKLLEALPAKDRALWATAMYAGLRRGELQALRVEDIDLGAGVIHVRHGWDQYEGEITTKSGRERKVPIPTVLRDHLDEHLLSLDHDGLVFGTTSADPFVATSIGFRALTAWGWKRAPNPRPVGPRTVWAKARDDAFEPITLHECRHTFASLMIAASVNAKALSTYMGHANIGITLDRYGHLMPGNEAEAAGLLDDYLARANTAARLAQLS